MTPGLLILVYCVLVAGASLLGGWLPQALRLTHTRMQIALSFVAGVMLGVGLLHLVPHSYFELRSVDRTVWWTLIGFLVMFFLQRLFHAHTHESVEEVVGEHQACNHEHSPAADSGHYHSQVGASSMAWLGATLGLTLHSLVDGIALAAGVQADWHGGEGIWLAGLGTFLAVFLHKPFDALTIGTLMMAGGWSIQARRAVNLAYALVAPLGATLFVLGSEKLGESQHVLLGQALGFAAGAFLCIASSDLLPELQFHTHDRFKLSFALLLGIGLAWAIVLFEHSGHEADTSHNHGAVESGQGHADHDHAGHTH